MEQFDVRFMIKASIFNRQGFNIFQAHSLVEGTYYLLRVLPMYMLSFSMIICSYTIEIGLYSLYRKNVIAAFKIVRSWYLFPRKKDDLSLQAMPFCRKELTILHAAGVIQKDGHFSEE